MRRRGKDTDDIRSAMVALINEELLPEHYRDHALIGSYRGRRECHIEPDWLLIYKLLGEGSEIRFERTGTHADLFR